MRSLCRSALYVPASNARALAKARGLTADVLIFDLEDAVLPAAKEGARHALAAALAEGGYEGRILAVRINGPDSAWYEKDLAVAASLPVDAVVVPKLQDAAVVSAVAATMAGLAAGNTPTLWGMIETPLGVVRAPSLAEALASAAGDHERLLIAGTADLSRDLRIGPDPSRAALVPALAQIVLAARAFGLGVLDGVHIDLSDDAGFEASCRQGRALGFDGKTLIHPRTITAANRAFAPAEEDVEQARRTIEAYEAAAQSGQGVALLDGQLVERLHAEAARDLLSLDQQIRRREGRPGAEI